MPPAEEPLDITDFVDGAAPSPEMEAWLAANPSAADDVAIARRVRGMLAQLYADPVDIPGDFEARLLARCRENATLLDVLDLSLAKGGRLLLELLEALLALWPASRAAAT